MLGKLIKTAFISVLATMTAVVVLRRLESDRENSTKPARLGEVDANQIEAPVRDALVQELQAHL